MSKVALKHPELLAVIDEHGSRTMGGDQYWYPKEGFIPPGACGATTASNILAYFLRTHPDFYYLAKSAGLEGIAEPYTADASGVRQGKTGIQPNPKTGYMEFMKKVYRFLYPRIGGLMVGEFLDGMAELAREYGLPVKAEHLYIPISRSKRPSFEEAAAYIKASIGADMPVAFLILSSGAEKNLDTWHWVTILALDESEKVIQIVDNGLVLQANLDVWLRTSIMGGSLALLRIST